MRAKLIKVDVEKGLKGLWHATSPDMPGLRVTETSHEELLAEIPRVLEASFDDVAAHQVEWKMSDDMFWVVVPIRKSA